MKDLVVGMFFLLALFILGALTFTKQGNPFAEKFHYTVRFADVSGLLEGEQVRVRGYKVGKVESIDVGQKDVAVTLILEQRQAPREGYSFSVGAASTLGGRYVDYDPGPATARELGGDELERLSGTTRSADVFESVGSFVEENRESFRRMVRNMERLSEQAAEGHGLLGALLRDRELADDARAAVASLRRIIGDVEEGDGLLGALLKDPQLAASARRTVANLEQVSGKINAGDGPLGVLVNDAELAATLRRIAGRTDELLADLQYGEGLLPRLIGDGVLADEFAQILDDASGVLDEIRQGRGLVPRLIQDPALAQTFDETLGGLNEMVASVNRAEGTLGLLVRSDSLYRDIESVVRSIREATEDAREQAPINTFVNVLFSAF